MSNNFVDYNNAEDLMNSVEDRIEKNYFKGTKEGWEALTDEQKAVYDQRVVHLKNGSNTPIDLSGYQTKALSSPIIVDGISQTQVEGALGALNTDYTRPIKVYAAANLDYITIIDEQPIGKISFIRAYAISGGINTPNGEADCDFQLIVQKPNDNAYATVIACDVRSNRTFVTTKVNGVWKGWKEITPTSTIANGSVAPVTSGAVFSALSSKLQLYSYPVNNTTDSSGNLYMGYVSDLGYPLTFYPDSNERVYNIPCTVVLDWAGAIYIKPLGSHWGTYQAVPNTALKGTLYCIK